jgi:hypothetical protein
MLLGTNVALSDEFAWTPGGYGIVLARMMEEASSRGTSPITVRRNDASSAATVGHG